MKKILIVEDEASIRENLKTILEMNQYNVEVAENGLVGVSKALEYQPDLIISDVLIPVIDGWDMVKKLRKMRAFYTVPVIMLTAKVEKNDFRHSMELGAEDYITKPFRSSEILKSVETQLHKRQMQQQRIKTELKTFFSSKNDEARVEMSEALNGIIGGADLIKNYACRLTENELRELADIILKSGNSIKKSWENIRVQ